MSVAALKVKLMNRPPFNQLVAQGIMPRKCCFVHVTYKYMLPATVNNYM